MIMNIKRYLKKTAERERKEALSAENDEMIRSLIESRIPQAANVETVREGNAAAMVAKRQRAIIIAVCAVALALAVTLIAVLIPLGLNKSELINFKHGYVEKISDIEELNADLTGLSVVDVNEVFVVKRMDKGTGDTAFYSVSTNPSKEPPVFISMFFVKDKEECEFLRPYLIKPREVVFAGYKLEYETYSEQRESGISVYLMHGTMETEEYNVYITQQVALTEEGFDFIESLSSVLIPKT